jgi:nucleoside-diphosphate-sugar epimerase
VKPQRVLLIGGSGFIGRHVARALVAAGHQVAVLARGRRDLPAGADLLEADRSDPASLAAALEGRHFDLTVDFLVFDAEDLERLLLVPHASLGRYVMISTGQVYLIASGATPPFREDDAERDLIPEPEPDSYEHASWSYGVGKRRAERVLLSLRGTHGMRATALRLPIVQGEGDGSLRLWAWLERMLDGGPILLPEGGVRPVRHVWAGDVARAVVWLAGPEPPRHVFYNLAQPDIVPLRKFLERVAAIAGLEPRVVDVEWDELKAAGFDEDVAPYAGRWASMPEPARAASEWGLLGTRLEDYLPGVVRWHLEHRPSHSHEGYAQRPRELEFAATRGAAR